MNVALLRALVAASESLQFAHGEARRANRFDIATEILNAADAVNKALIALVKAPTTSTETTS